MNKPILETNLPFPCRRGKVRDCYDLGETLLIVSTDRISAFDYILPNGIPDKGRILTQLSKFWFEALGIAHHLISTEVPAEVAALDPEGNLQGRVMIVRKAKVLPFECVVRGYLEGSGWKDYQQTQSVCGIPLPVGLKQCDRLVELAGGPLFTPATKEESGHDENVSFERMASDLGLETANELKAKSLLVYQRGSEIAREKGIIIADTKFEWGRFGDEIILIDEVLTPDSSRFWSLDDYEPGRAQQSFDKQFVREYLLSSSWDRQSPPPALPEAIVAKTREKYVEAYERLSGQAFGF
jgi:phosphoribosylaminoimidazole-succinocarboxamide synthase